jgi:hypothetical protein
MRPEAAASCAMRSQRSLTTAKHWPAHYKYGRPSHFKQHVREPRLGIASLQHAGAPQVALAAKRRDTAAPAPIFSLFHRHGPASDFCK